MARSEPRRDKSSGFPFVATAFSQVAGCRLQIALRHKYGDQWGQYDDQSARARVTGREQGSWGHGLGARAQWKGETGHMARLPDQSLS